MSNKPMNDDSVDEANNHYAPTDELEDILINLAWNGTYQDAGQTVVDESSVKTARQKLDQYYAAIREEAVREARENQMQRVDPYIDPVFRQLFEHEFYQLKASKKKGE